LEITRTEGARRHPPPATAPAANSIDRYEMMRGNMMTQYTPEQIETMANYWAVDYDMAEAFCVVGWHYSDLLTDMYQEQITAEGSPEVLDTPLSVGLVSRNGREFTLTEKGERYVEQMLGARRVDPHQMELFVQDLTA
jgi:hypothetical protein